MPLCLYCTAVWRGSCTKLKVIHLSPTLSPFRTTDRNLQVLPIVLLLAFRNRTNPKVQFRVGRFLPASPYGNALFPLIAHIFPLLYCVRPYSRHYMHFGIFPLHGLNICQFSPFPYPPFCGFRQERTPLSELFCFRQGIGRLLLSSVERLRNIEQAGIEPATVPISDSTKQPKKACRIEPTLRAAHKFRQSYSLCALTKRLRKPFVHFLSARTVQLMRFLKTPRHSFKSRPYTPKRYQTACISPQQSRRIVLLFRTCCHLISFFRHLYGRYQPLEDLAIHSPQAAAGSDVKKIKIRFVTTSLLHGHILLLFDRYIIT